MRILIDQTHTFIRLKQTNKQTWFMCHISHYKHTCWDTTNAFTDICNKCADWTKQITNAASEQCRMHSTEQTCISTSKVTSSLWSVVSASFGMQWCKNYHTTLPYFAHVSHIAIGRAAPLIHLWLMTLYKCIYLLTYLADEASAWSHGWQRVT